MENPLVSIYITNYNYGHFIEYAIQSVLQQKYNNIELIVIDDGSTDNSKSIINKYSGKGLIDKLIFQQNLGLNRTNNIAIKNANGKYIMRLDADDFLHDSAVNIMVAILESDDELGLVFPDYYYINDKGEVTGQERRHNFESEVSLFDMPAHGACTLIRKKCLLEVGGYDEEFSCQDGYDLWLKITNQFAVTNISRRLFYYRRHGNNLTNKVEHILDTRRRIKAKYYRNNHDELPSCIAILPVRINRVNGVEWPLESEAGGSVNNSPLELLLDKIQDSDTVNKIIVTSSDKRIRQIVENFNCDNVEFIERPLKYEDFMHDLNDTYNHILSSLNISAQSEYDLLMTIAPEFPFLNAHIIDDAVYSLLLFKVDSIITVKPVNDTFYTHNGHTLKTIVDQAGLTKYERNAIFRGIRAIRLGKINNLQKFGHLLGGKIGQIEIDDFAAVEINSSLNYQFYRSLSNNLLE